MTFANLEEGYHPTIWRTCRCLANYTRLDCLRHVVKLPGINVAAVTLAAEISVVEASRALRALQSRGIITAERDGRWVRYYPHSDPLVTIAGSLLELIKAAFDRDVPNQEIFRQLTVFTHPRRVMILPELSEDDGVFIAALGRKFKISQRAMARHLAKLIDRDMVVVKGARVYLSPLRPRIASEILTLLS